MKYIVFYLIVFAQAEVLLAESYSIDWFTVDGGGGTSVGGIYSLSGTIGQPDAGKMSGGNFTLDGGFWGTIASVQTSGAPPLTITRIAPNTVRVSWPSPSTGFVLQQNGSLAAPTWVNSQTPADDGTTKSVQITPPTGNLYFRLKK